MGRRSGRECMISKFALDLTSDIAGLIGGILLVKPALRANRLAKQRLKIDKIELNDTDPVVIHKLRAAASTKIGQKITTWDPSDELAVLTGIIFVILSFGIKIVWALVMGPEAAASTI
jgi:hypothetical protein